MFGVEKIGLDERESFIYGALLVLVLSVLIFNYWKSYQQFWSPLSIIAIVYGYYCLLGPYNALITGDTSDRLVNMRPYYYSAFLGAFISLVSFLCGFVLKNGKSKQAPEMPDQYLFHYGKRLFIVGFIFFTISTGGKVHKLINPLDAEYVGNIGGSFVNYFSLCINFLIGSSGLIFLYLLRTGKGKWWFLITFILTIGLFTTLGFRYRIVLLLTTLVIIYYFNFKKKPSLILLSAGIVFLIVIMGVINLTRRYGIGLDVSRLEGEDSKSYYESGLKESGIFQTSGAVIDIVPDRHPFAGFQPIWSTLLFPIPKTIYSEKDSFEYLKKTLDAVYGSSINSQGAAIMGYAEYYLAFGWYGIIVGSFLLGWFYKKLWLWYLYNSHVPIVSVVYAVCTVYLYVILSRGYLPQVTNLFFFTVFPVFITFILAKKKYRIHSFFNKNHIGV